MTELTVELSILMWAALVYVLQIHLPALGADASNGIKWALGNRDEQPQLPAWVDRARRAQANMAENLLPFACLVLVVQVSGSSGDWSVLGAQLFLASRIAYFVLYVAGITVLRSIAFMAGLAGMLMLAFQLIPLS